MKKTSLLPFFVSLAICGLCVAAALYFACCSSQQTKPTPFTTKRAEMDSGKVYGTPSFSLVAEPAAIGPTTLYSGADVSVQILPLYRF